MDSRKPSAVPCKSEACKRTVLWCVHEDGTRPHPIDAEPVANGDTAVWLRGGRLVMKPYEEADAAKGARRYQSHFATCPDAPKWRKKR